jgi:polysaccharide pyruvyl transferase WcaK-like protein
MRINKKIGKSFKKIGILDHMGYGNLGDAAVQEAFTENVKRRLPNALFIGFSLNPSDTSKRHKIACYPIRWSYPGGNESEAPPNNIIRLNLKLKTVLKKYLFFYSVAKPIYGLLREVAHLKRSYRVVRSLDLLIISGGGQLGELWKGPWFMPYNIFKFAILAKLSNTSFFILNVGAGPLEHPLSRFFAGWAVRIADYTSFRDVESQVLVRDLGVKAKTYVYPDPVYALNLREYITDKTPSTSMPTVGLNPMGYCDPRIWPQQNYSVYSSYLDKLASFTLWLLMQNYNVEIFTSSSGVDQCAIEDLKSRLLADVPPDRIEKMFQPLSLSVSDLLHQMSQFDFVITPKFHGVIFSHLLSKPVIALSYHKKIDDLMRAVGHYGYCLDIEHFDVASLIETFNLLVQNGDDLRSLFRKTVESYSNALQMQFDDLFLSQR